MALAYFITFTMYGNWLHGDDRSSADRNHNTYGTPYLPADPKLRTYRERAMTAPPYQLDQPRRKLVIESVTQHAAFRRWQLYAVHVRPAHVHIVSSGDRTPERMMDEFKAYASRALNRAGIDAGEVKRWTRHGSTRHLFTDDAVWRAAEYALDEQGERMEVYDGRHHIAGIPVEARSLEPRPPGSG